MVLDALPRTPHGSAMPIERFTEAEQARLREAGQVAAATLAWVGSQLCAGMSTADIDALVREDTRRRGGKPSQLGYHGFPAAVCTSVNDVVCHGIPSATLILREGDLVNVDVTTLLDGFHGDTSATFPIGRVAPEVELLLTRARACRDVGIDQVGPDARLGDIGAAIATLAHSYGYSVVREFGGHGIGRTMHADPHVPHVGHRGRGLRLRPGMALTIEPMINVGSAGIALDGDGWTVRTADGSLSAQFEHTILVTETGHEVLTLPPATLAQAPIQAQTNQPLSCG